MKTGCKEIRVVKLAKLPTGLTKASHIPLRLKQFASLAFSLMRYQSHRIMMASETPL
jgi:hypothetical protein